MARPKGLRLHPQGLTLYREVAQLHTLTDTADRLGLTLPVLSGLASGKSRASLKTVRQIEDRIGPTYTLAIFPTLSGLFSEATSVIVEDEAAA